MTNLRNIFITLAAAAALQAAAATPGATEPAWLERDSAAAIAARTLSDFTLSLQQGRQAVRQAYPQLTEADIDQAIANRWLETKQFGSETRVFRKAVKNLALLHPKLHGGRVAPRGAKASAQRLAFVDSVLQWQRGTLPDGGAHRVTFSFTVDVPWHEALRDDTLRVWMPLPHLSARQSDLQLISVSHPGYIISQPDQSVHHTLYIKVPVQNGMDTRLSYTAAYTAAGLYFSPDSIRANIRPYDTASELYRRYTAVELPHMPDMSALARQIVGNETDPYSCSELVYDYIIQRYPWAGAREYSTIACIPAYVVREGHGDCGQVSLLYISLMRSLGIPARWESGWMLHPGEKNYHDWAEVYFEGVGWVPVDVSFGRYNGSADPAVQRFYSTGMDAHRLASNLGVAGELYPAKRYVRSETVDFQAGEVESTRGNLFYPAWSHSLKLINVKPVQK